ncbi:MAG: adenosine deaminase [Bryobacter sp.]|nr:adenosine deaminase [Bryobacter sp.]
MKGPVAELHVHLEGSLEPATLIAIDPALTAEEIAGRYRFANFTEFLRAYKWVVRKLNAPEHYALAARALFTRLAAQGVVHAEVSLSVGVILWKQQDVAAVYDALRAESAAAPLRVGWIFDAVRQFGAKEAMRVAELAAERAGDGVAGFGIGGDEAGWPASELQPVFDFARRRGLHLVPHAGETTNARNVWDALRWGAERVGHGIRAVQDPDLLRHLARERIPLEICLSSNAATGAVASLEEHPLRRLLDAGVVVTLNTDDPAMFRTTLPREYELAREVLGLTEEELDHIAAASLACAFRDYSMAKVNDAQ